VAVAVVVLIMGLVVVDFVEDQIMGDSIDVLIMVAMFCCT